MAATAAPVAGNVEQKRTADAARMSLSLDGNNGCGVSLIWGATNESVRVRYTSACIMRCRMGSIHRNAVGSLVTWALPPLRAVDWKAPRGRNRTDL